VEDQRLKFLQKFPHTKVQDKVSSNRIIQLEQ